MGSVPIVCMMHAVGFQADYASMAELLWNGVHEALWQLES